MTFLIITGAPLVKSGNRFSGYAPYIKEMNIWAKYINSIVFCCPVLENEKNMLAAEVNFPIADTIKLTQFNIKKKRNIPAAFFLSISNAIAIAKAIRHADHIHLRCPGNIGLIACIIQIFFPNKPKTTKYAGNWDPKSKQPLSYKIQKWILSNTFLTRNMQVLVYGNWPGASKNILPFFTASYSISDIMHTAAREISKQHTLQLIYVGALSAGKQPMLSVKTAEELQKKGLDVVLNIFGEGAERPKLEAYIQASNLQKTVYLRGNQPAEIVKQFYIQSQFLIFISKSEGWPKVVAESMFWGCVPITTAVSCVPQMLGNGTRGTLVQANVEEVINAVMTYVERPENYTLAANAGMQWSRQYTLEKFETEIAKLL